MSQELGEAEMTFVETDEAIGIAAVLHSQEFNYHFHDNECGEIGDFRWNRDKKLFEFTGDCDASAKLFVESLLRQSNQWFEEEYGDAPKIR